MHWLIGNCTAKNFLKGLLHISQLILSLLVSAPLNYHHSVCFQRFRPFLSSHQEPPSLVGKCLKMLCYRKKYSMRSLQGFCQTPLGESGISPIHPKMSSCHPCALEMPKNRTYRQ